jgi:hypothetical protein
MTVVCSSLAKALVEYSSFTVAKLPVLVQVIFWLAPTTQTSVPLGAVRVTEPLISKGALESSNTVASAVLVMRTRRAVPMASGTVQA